MRPTITKEEISTLEVEQFEGRIIVIQSLEEAEKAIQYLKKFSIIGFDTETRPNYKKGKLHHVALMQLAIQDACFLFRLNIIGFPDCLKELLSDPAIKKVGLSLRDDFITIRRSVDIEPEGFEDLQKTVPLYGIQDCSLQKIYAILFNKKISKNQRLTNWEADVLSESQKKYAALDAWACLQIYNELSRLIKT